MLYTRWKNQVLPMVIVCVLLVGSALAASPARTQLETSIDALLEILRDDTLKGEANTEKRREKLRTVIYKRFDFQKMSQLSLAKHWRSRTPEEKKEFVALFGRLLEDTYVTKIEAYTDEKVAYGKERIKKDKAQISTKILTDSVEIPIDYRMYAAKGDQWMVYDMVIEGVSLIGNYRSQFAQMLDSGSFNDLIEKLKQKSRD